MEVRDNSRRPRSQALSQHASPPKRVDVATWPGVRKPHRHDANRSGASLDVAFTQAFKESLLANCDFSARDVSLFDDSAVSPLELLQLQENRVRLVILFCIYLVLSVVLPRYPVAERTISCDRLLT